MKRYVVLWTLLSLSPVAAVAQLQPRSSSTVVRQVQVQQFFGSQKEKFVIAFLRHVSEDTDAHIEVALSEDGINWSDALFPSPSSIPLSRISGVGVCGSSDGRSLTVVSNDTWGWGSINIVEGSVSGTSVSWGTPSFVFAPLADSAPSCAYLQQGARVIAYVAGKSVIANVYLGGYEFVQSAVPATFNENAGPPSLVELNGKILMAWGNNRTAGCPDLVLAQGEVIQQQQFTTFVFNKSGTLGLDDAGVTPCALSDPAVAADGSSFYVTVVQHQRSAGPSQGWASQLYKSQGPDLYSGWAEAPGMGLQSQYGDYIRLAGKRDGTLLTTRVRDDHSPHGANGTGGELYSKGNQANWSYLDIGKAPWVNGGDASYRQFGLARFGLNTPGVGGPVVNPGVPR